MARLLQTLLVLASVPVAGCSPSATTTDAGHDAGSVDVTTPDAAPRSDVAPDMPLGPLVTADAWETAPADIDPFDDRPDEVTCERGIGWGIEELDGQQTIEMASGSCDYLAATQPLLSDIEAGESLTVHFVHFELTGAGEAHPAIAIDGEVVWEKRIPIPQSTFQVYVEDFTVPDGAAAGSAVVFHLHNHGINTYNLVDVRRTE